MGRRDLTGGVKVQRRRLQFRVAQRKLRRRRADINYITEHPDLDDKQREAAISFLAENRSATELDSDTRTIVRQHLKSAQTQWHRYFRHRIHLLDRLNKNPL